MRMQKSHLRLLAEVARTLGNDDAVEALLNAGNSRKI